MKPYMQEHIRLHEVISLHLAARGHFYWGTWLQIQPQCWHNLHSVASPSAGFHSWLFRFRFTINFACVFAQSSHSLMHFAHAVITGSSTHNERIERLWCDVYRCMGVVFADTFRALEADDHLDCLNEVDLFCLHFIFLPRINSVLTQFVESWNNHSQSSAHNLTPNQLFIRGVIEQYDNNRKSHLVLMQVDIQHHQTMWGCQETDFNHVILYSPFCLLLTH